jgi:PAS domain S-box-containing protein
LSVPAGTRWFEVSASRLAGDPGAPHFILICRDVTERRRLEDGIRSSNELFQTVLDAIPQYIICWKDRRSVFLGCNKRHAELFGLPDTKAVIGKTDWDLHRDAAEIESFIRDDREVMEADVPRYHIVESAHYPDGRQRWLETNKVPLHDSGGSVCGVMIAYADVTERLEAERLQRESDFLYAAVLNASPDGIAITDPAGGMVMLSKSVTRMFDIRAEEAIGHSILEFIEEPDRERASSNIGLMLEGVMTGPAVYRGIRGDGTALKIEVNAEVLRDAERRPFRLIYVVRDISGRELGARALVQENSLLKVLLETSSDHIYFKDLSSRFLMNSRAHARFMGVEDPAMLIGKTDFDFFTDKHAKEAYDDEQAIIRTGVAIKKEETNIKPEGPDSWVLTEKMPLRDPDGNIIGTFGISRDITERKLNEKRIQSLLDEKELILKEVHHRIKNNMSVIHSLLSLQAASLTEPGAVKALKDAEGRIESMLVLYEQLYQSSEFTDIPASEYLDSLIDRMLANSNDCEFVTVRKGIEAFDLDIKKTQTLGIIINELISNILKYAFAGRCEGEIALSGRCEGNHITISVEDDGVGMPEDVSFGNSTGFGLTLVGALTEQLKGAIRIERGKGTKVVLEFDK